MKKTNPAFILKGIFGVKRMMEVQEETVKVQEENAFHFL